MLPRFGIVGSGPAGFYTAKYLLKEVPNCRIDIYDRLPHPYGLVRTGVAPDHPEVKNVTHDFDKVATDERCRFIGNVHVGRDITVPEMRSMYSALVFSCGASEDRRLGIPGEDLKGVHSARSFVNWYNGHAEYAEREFGLDQTDTAVIIGQGNVAIDCARILSKTVDELRHTDIAEHALEALSKSTIKRVHVVGRRGPVQAAFTMKELREVTKLDVCEAVVSQEDMFNGFTAASEEEIKEERARKRIYELLKTVADKAPNTQASRHLYIRFLLNPLCFVATSDDPTKLSVAQFEKTRLEGLPGDQRAVGTGVIEEISCGLVLRSIGYRSLPIPDLPFDVRRAVIPNVQGRVVNAGEHIPGVYCVGWLKRGPSGIIGTNITDAQDTVASLVEDLQAGKVEIKAQHTGFEEASKLLSARKSLWVSFEEWLKISREEEARGAVLGKPRSKITRIDEMLKVAHG
eukprot:GILK01006151.1.p1 GENE.GILK01006151.1~~GILK01006151.1.p1  ORF type:complete len:460 (-),score=67.19 GILK01006151.1:50-1429(-)